jgi:hypothetical protein
MRHLVVLTAALAIAAPSFAQTKEPLPLFAADLHAATVGLPQAEGWVPAVSADTELPGRSWGFAGGASVYPSRLGVITFGFGASFAMAEGSGESLTITTGSGDTAVTRVTPVVHTGMTSILPQLSLNFGQKFGWSYLSAGLGYSKVSSRAEAVGSTPEVVLPEAWNQAINFGGGAR